MNKNPLVETKRFWHPGTGIVHSDPDCTSARRTKWDLIELEPGNLPEMIVTCKRCLKNPNAADDKGEQCIYCGELQDCEAQRDELLLAAKALIEALPPKGDRNKRYSPQCDAVEAAIAKVETASYAAEGSK